MFACSLAGLSRAVIGETELDAALNATLRALLANSACPQDAEGIDNDPNWRRQRQAPIDALLR